MRVPAFAILISCLASAALADDFKTTEDKEYKNATVLCVEPDGIVIKTRAGISKLYFSELPPEVLERFHFGSQWSAQLPAGANEEIRITQQQNIEEDQECEDEAPRKVKIAQEKQRAILAKAESIRIPHIDFRDVTVREAIESLAAQGHDHDPGGTGVVIGMFMNDIEPEGEPIPRLTLSLQDVTLFQAVTAVAQEMGFSVCVSSFGLDIHCVHREFPGWKISVRCIKPAKEELSDFDRRIVESTVQSASVIALAKWERSRCTLRCVVTDILKQAPGSAFYYKVGDEISDLDEQVTSKLNYGDGQVLFYTGSPARLEQTATYCGDRIAGLGGIPISNLREIVDRSK